MKHFVVIVSPQGTNGCNRGYVLRGAGNREHAETETHTTEDRC